MADMVRLAGLDVSKDKLDVYVARRVRADGWL